MAELYIKQGASFQLLIAVQNDDGSAFDLTTVTASSQVRDDADRLICTLELTTTGVAGQLSVLQATDAWPTGTLVFDLKFVDAGVVLKSNSVQIQVDAAVTV